MRRMTLGLAVGVVVWLSAAPPTAAREAVYCPVCHRKVSSTTEYTDKVGRALARGATNALLGWTDIIREPARETKRSGNVAAGIAQGFGQGIKRTAGGIADLLTFWTPKINGEYVHFTTDCPICHGVVTAPSAPATPSAASSTKPATPPRER